MSLLRPSLEATFFVSRDVKSNTFLCVAFQPTLNPLDFCLHILRVTRLNAHRDDLTQPAHDQSFAILDREADLVPDWGFSQINRRGDLAKAQPTTPGLNNGSVDDEYEFTGDDFMFEAMELDNL
ncbi:hypothetical protein HDU93_000942 [Gonapodya sp. JEL0774]|nr:hypothetical protein HDU93_000942 [Gonapodya sp. JEL0774]